MFRKFISTELQDFLGAEFQKDTAHIMQEGEVFEQAIKTKLAPAIDGASEIKPNVIVVTGGKGGVGKSLIAAHLALQLIARGQRVFLIDWDGSPKLKQALCGERGMTQTLDYLSYNGKTFPVFTTFNADSWATDRQVISNKNDQLYKYLNSFFKPDSNSLKMLKSFDTILIDNSAGNELHETILGFLFDFQLVVTMPEETAMLDASSHIRTLAAQNKTNPQKFHLLFNSCLEEDQLQSSGTAQQYRMANLCKEFLAEYRPSSSLRYTVNIPYEPKLAEQPYLKRERPQVPAINALAELILKTRNINR